MVFDDIIVGSGSSGAVLAARLSEDSDRKVLLIEAGPDYPSVASTPGTLLDGRHLPSNHDWGLTAEMVRSRLAALGFGQRDLARAAQVTDSHIFPWLTRRKSPPARDRTDIHEKMGAFLR